MLVIWQTNCGNSRLFLFDFKVCAFPYCSDIGRKGFFVPIFYKMIVYVYICLHIKVLRRQILSLDLKYVSKMLYYVSFCIYLYPYEQVNCALMYGFALESILKGI